MSGKLQLPNHVLECTLRGHRSSHCPDEDAVTTATERAEGRNMVDESLLQECADRSVRLVALSLLEDAQKAADNLTRVAKQLRDGDAESDDALHDFRVAVRRLRSWTRAFEPRLRDAMSRKQRRGLSEIADATGANRDATVQLAWLREERRSLTTRQRIGRAWLSERLETQRNHGADAALEAAKEFGQMVARLDQRLNVYRSTVRAHDRSERFGPCLAEELVNASDALRDRLATIHDVTDVNACHRARIAAKRLRYLAEPVSKLTSGGDAIIETLKTLQDALGALHDVHVFSELVMSATEEASVLQAKRVAETELGDGNGDGRVRRVRSRDPGPGLIRLARRLHERGARAYAGIERDWLNDAGAPFFDRVRDLATELTHRALAGTEIERKYLLERRPAAALAAPSVEIVQGYLPGETLVERVRRVRSPDGTERWFRTVKVGSGLRRTELEEETDAVLGRAMWRLTKGRRIHKRRYSIRESDAVVWEIDEFLDRRLVVAEIELPALDAVVELPPWLRAVLNREVTEESKYANARLAR